MIRRAVPAIAAAVAASTLVVAGASAVSSSSRTDLHSRTLKPSHTKIEGYSGAKTATLSARVTVPRSWSIVTDKPAVQTYREGSQICRYTVRARTKLVVTAADAATYAATYAPETGRRVIDSGQRGGSVWRVTLVPNTGNDTVLKGIGVYPRSLGSNNKDVTGAGRAFQVVTFDARSAPNSECHSGTYREVLGPQIGDALALSRTRAYIDFT